MQTVEIRTTVGKMIQMPVCPRCRKIAPQCKCGQPTRRPV